MTLSEFKAWFEGFTEDMSTAPNKKQWERIKERVGEITGQSVSYPVFVDRYWPQYPQRPYWQYGAIGIAGQALQGYAQTYAGASQQGVLAGGQQGGYATNAAHFDSHEAMRALGKNDYNS